MGTKLLILAQSYIFTGWIDLGKAISDMFGGGDSKDDLINAANSLDNIRPYLHFQDAVGQVFNWIKWGIIKGVYSMANAAENLATNSLDFSKILQDAGLNKWIQGYILGAAAAVMIAVLVWIGIKMMLGKEKTPVQNVILQAIIATFLIFNLQPLTNWVVDQSTNIYKAEVTEGDTSSIPFEIIKGNTNDIAYLVYNNWPDFGTKKDSGKIKTLTDEDYGYNGWGGKDGKKSFDRLSATNLASAITPDTVDAMEKTAEKLQKDHNWKTLKFKPKYLKYQLIDGGDKPAAVKIGKSSVPFSNSYSGGYQRYTVAFLPVVVSLLALSVAFLFITYVIIKSFLDLAIMQILALLIFSTDLDSGARTKAAIQDMFTAALTIALQGFELAFYRIVVNFMTNADMGPVLYCVAMIAATAMLWTGSSKTAKFFGVDTGAQKGWAMGAIAANQTAGLFKKGAGLIGGSVKGTAKMAHKAVDLGGAGKTGVAAATKAHKNGKTWGDSFHEGYNASHAKSQLKKDFLAGGGSRHQWNKANRTGLVPTTVSEMADRMRQNNGLTDNEYNALRKPTSDKNRYEDFALKHANTTQKSGLKSSIEEAKSALYTAYPVKNNSQGVAEARKDLRHAVKEGKQTINDPNATDKEMDQAKSKIDVAAERYRKATGMTPPNIPPIPNRSETDENTKIDESKDKITTPPNIDQTTDSKDNDKPPVPPINTEAKEMPKVSEENVQGQGNKKKILEKSTPDEITKSKEKAKESIVTNHEPDDPSTETKDNKVNELPKVGEEQIQGQDNRKHITEKGGTNQITKAKEKGIDQKINSQDDEKKDDIPTNTVASETTKLSEEQVQGQGTRKNIIEKGGVDQISKIKDQTNNPSTITNEKTVGSSDQHIPTNTESTPVSEEQIQGQGSKKNIVEKGGVDQISKIKDQTNNPSTITNEKTIETPAPSSPTTGSTTVSEEQVQGHGGSKNVIEKTAPQSVTITKDKSGRPTITTTTTSQTSAVTNPEVIQPDTQEQTIQESPQKVNITKTGGSQDITISSQPSSTNTTVSETPTKFAAPDPTLVSNNPSAPTLESVLHGKHYVKHYTQNVKQDVTTEINREQIDHHIDKFNKKVDFKSTNSNNIAPKPPRKDK
ncbi:pLS20_p028 family conjugation system transmembrane protein [Lactobacillus johnsonii]|uniref:pLS20_p028 family conjugation system transmembrane protein n=1 Tax=Lactobacillus johnsonii TaxID=33959 RepID=UPI00192A5E39|nr:hypothetical protein [Lactobacillus johnsonii]TWU79345.1 hypothetical protein DLD91_01930 [Lactobacillus johnsonii]